MLNVINPVGAIDRRVKIVTSLPKYCLVSRPKIVYALHFLRTGLITLFFDCHFNKGVLAMTNLNGL